MTLLYTKNIKNGDQYQPYKIYKCDNCGNTIEEAWPMSLHDNLTYCWDCTFILGYVTGDKYLDGGTGFNSKMFRAAINPKTGEIAITWRRSRFLWEKRQKGKITKLDRGQQRG